MLYEIFNKAIVFLILVLWKISLPKIRVSQKTLTKVNFISWWWVSVVIGSFVKQVLKKQWPNDK